MKRSGLLLAVAALALGACGSSRGVVDVPGVDRLSLSQAYKVLRAHHLRVRVAFLNTDRLSVSSRGEAMVDLMKPAPGTRIGEGETVTLVTGRPRMGVAGHGCLGLKTPPYRVPNFVGGSAQKAITWAKYDCLDWVIPKLPPLASSWQRRFYAAYRIIAQRPKPGGFLKQGHFTPSGDFRSMPLTLTVVAR